MMNFDVTCAENVLNGTEGIYRNHLFRENVLDDTKSWLTGQGKAGRGQGNHLCHWVNFIRACSCRAKMKKAPRKTEVLFLEWEQRESNPRPSACKADALNQLSYAPKRFFNLWLLNQDLNLGPSD